MKTLVIGDPHFKTSNIQEIDRFVVGLKELIDNELSDITNIVMLGDLLHEHERLHVTPLNKAYDFIRMLANIAPTYCLVGNHDLINNRQFLSTNHWMNAMKQWDNVTIIDKPVIVDTYLFVPYVPPSRFLDAIAGLDWMSCDCIFAHQEFKGCKMGAIISEEGDSWDADNPFVISGHIHSNQWVGNNIYYPGACMQHAFGESEHNVIAVFNRECCNKDSITEYDLKLPRKRIIYKDVTDDLDVEVGTDQIKLALTGNPEQFKSFRKTSQYKKLIKKGVKITYKYKKTKDDIVDREDILNTSSFESVLKDLVDNQKLDLQTEYKQVMS